MADTAGLGIPGVHILVSGLFALPGTGKSPSQCFYIAEESHMATKNVNWLELEDLRQSAETSPSSEETCRKLTGHLNVNRCGGGS